MKEYNYEQDVSIDMFNLDKECAKQASLIMEYSRHLADARKELNTLLQNKDYTVANTELAIRQKASASGEKVTEALIASRTTIDDNVVEVNTAIISKKYEVEILQSAVNAFEHKKRELDNLVRLHISNYYMAKQTTGDAGSDAQLQYLNKEELYDE